MQWELFYIKSPFQGTYTCLLNFAIPPANTKSQIRSHEHISKPSPSTPKNWILINQKDYKRKSNTCGCCCGCGWGCGCGWICGCICEVVICVGLTKLGGWSACVIGGWPMRLVPVVGWAMVCWARAGWARVWRPPRPGGWIMLCWTGAYWGCWGAPPSTNCWLGAEGCCPRREGCSCVDCGRCCHGGGAFPPNCDISPVRMTINIFSFIIVENCLE